MECVICFNIINNNELLIKTDCNHIFCKPCLYNWQKNNNNCPLCRQCLKINNNFRDNINDTLSNTQQLIIENTNLINSFNQIINDSTSFFLKKKYELIFDEKQLDSIEYIETKNNLKIIINKIK